MDSLTLNQCTHAAVIVLERWLPHTLARHVVGQALCCWALDESISLPTVVEESLRHLPCSGFRQPIPELSDEQIKRAALCVTVAVERALTQMRPVSVEHQAHHAVRGDVDCDHEVERVVVEAVSHR